MEGSWAHQAPESQVLDLPGGLTRQMPVRVRARALLSPRAEHAESSWLTAGRSASLETGQPRDDVPERTGDIRRTSLAVAIKQVLESSPRLIKRVHAVGNVSRDVPQAISHVRSTSASSGFPHLSSPGSRGRTPRTARNSLPRRLLRSLTSPPLRQRDEARDGRRKSAAVADMARSWNCRAIEHLR